MNNTPVLLSLHNVVKTYFIKGQTLKVLDNVSLEFEEGTFTSIKGPSGAGKSTLLYIIGMLLKYDGGDIFLEGKKISEFSSRKKASVRNTEIGFIFQSYHLLPEFTALENILLPALLHGISKKEAEDRAMTLLGKVNLGNREHHKPSELSGGEQQRICICRALINSPKLILADEPTGNLDTHNTGLVIDMLEALCREYKNTLIMVTHNEQLAAKTDRCISLLDGKVVS